MELTHYLLILARMSGAVYMLPILGTYPVPLQVRFALSALLSLGIYQQIPRVRGDFALCFASELLFGIFIGLTARAFFSLFHVLAAIIAAQSGLGYGYFFSRDVIEQGSVFYNFFFLAAACCMFESGLVHAFVLAAMGSYEKLALGAALPLEDMAQRMSSAVSQSLAIGLRFSMPFILVNFVLLVGGGALSRLVPAFPTFFLITPVQAITVFWVLCLLLSKIISSAVEVLRGASAL